MKQGQKESVRDYFDRVNNSVHLSANDSLVAMRLDRAITTADEGFKACITHFMRVHYVSGLKPEIRCLVEAKFSSLKTKEEMVKAAVKADVASGEEARHIATFEAELTALRISAGQQFSGRGRAFTRGTRGARGSSRGGVFFFFFVGADMVKPMSYGGPPDFTLSGSTSSTPRPGSP